MKTIGLDIGTTTICAVLADAETGRQLDVQTLPNDCGVCGEHGFERLQDADRILEKCRKLLKGYLGEHSDVASIGLSGQMHGIVYADRDGKAVSPLFTWQDKRGDEVNPASGIRYAQELSEKTGYPMATGFGLTTHYYNTINHLVPDGAACLMTIADYVSRSIVVRPKSGIHQSMAASMGLYDVEKGSFDREAVIKAGMDPSLLPGVTRENDRCGETEQGIPVAVPLGDNQASFFGSVNPECRVLLNVGTGGQLSAYSETTAQGREIENRPYIGNTYLLCGSSLCGGYSYSLMKRFYEEVLESAGVQIDADIYGILNREAKRAWQEEKQLTVDTRFNGTRKNPELTGSVTGITADTFRPGHLALGVLKGICEELYQHYVSLPDAVKSADSFVGSGNGIRKNPLLQEICTRRFGMRLRIPRYSEEAAYGAALFALLSGGYCTSMEEVQAKIHYQ